MTPAPADESQKATLAKRPGKGRDFRPGGVTEARTAAAMMLADLRSGMLLDAAFERRAGTLDARDRRWTQELVWGMLRRRGWIDAVLASRVKGGLAKIDDDLTDLLRLGVQQLINMGSVPAYAAIAQTVELAKRRHGIGASKLVNAILRRVDRERDALEPAQPADPVDALAQRHSHPRWIVARWVERWGLASTEQLLVSNNMEASINVRPYGVSIEELVAGLDVAEVESYSVPTYSTGQTSVRLQPGVMLSDLDVFNEGKMFVQDPGATLVTEYAAVPQGSMVADLCAAPGGKALELARSARMVVAGDRNFSRVEKMLVGLGRVDATNLLSMVADARFPAILPVDVVLVDVPCTGTGTLRRHPDARWRLRISDFAVLGALQKSILRAAAEVVAPGGLLVYSTCSLEPEENDEQVDSFLAENKEFTLEAPPGDAVSHEVLDNGRLRVLPQIHGTDGAFAARLRRRA